MKRLIYIYTTEEERVLLGSKSRHIAVMEVEATEPLETLMKSDCRLVVKQNDLPNTKEQVDSGPIPVFPKTPQEIDSLLSSTNIENLGKAVGLWRVEGCVTNGQCRNLMQHLVLLEQVYDRFRQALLGIVGDKPRLKDEEEAG